MTSVAVIASTGLVSGVLSLGLAWRRRAVPCGCVVSRRAETPGEMPSPVPSEARADVQDQIDRNRRECLERMARLAEKVEMAERGAQSGSEFLGEGRLGMPARARALRMLRAGVAAETAATELGLATAEVRLLKKVGSLLASPD